MDKQSVSSGRSRWIVIFLVLLMALVTPFMANDPLPSGKAGLIEVVIVSILELAYVSVLIAFFNPRFSSLPFQVFRLITAMIFLAYVSYAVYELFFSHAPFFGSRPSDTSSFNALRGLFIYGLPSLWYTIFGKSRHDAEKGDSERPNS
jgi:hypothetical protein